MKLLKETKADGSPAEPRAHGRWYDDACGTAFGLEVIGERWSLLVVRELMFGGRRFSDLRASLPRISAKVLTERLERLTQMGVVRRTAQAVPIPTLYELTQWGRRAEPLLQEIGRWAAMSPAHDPTLPLSPVSLMLSLRTMLDRTELARISAAPGGRIGFAIGGAEFVAVLHGDLPIARELVAGCDAVIRAPDAPVLAGFFYGGTSLADLERGEGVVVEGSRPLVEEFARCFSLPEPVTA
ncbi:putative HTH-type transcriptional regulator YvaP [Alteripontixanthobacter maritimus]|uniref:Putative HTH-type transcriptional regulator YvaP n=1 Tax=Alteripontixanthobacter maritimus TaxID=2161824 RepID=A0A369Q7U5_9SPHN|nr:helix-turn-helix domain-containing protein [Alteripontixanthobacter maritimus]RDC60450.1 putative HTH-type transcriptional regulator YvaP [Alteripontixanthobacter maritimus]